MRRSGILFLNKRVEDSRRTFILEDGVPRRPDSYPKEQWPVDLQGRPSDPWGLQYELPLISVDDGRTVVFKASTIITRAAIGRLLADYAETVRRPFVTLEVIANPDNVAAMISNFLITGHSDDDSDVPALNVPSPTSSPTGAATSIKAPADMDDGIPFAAEFR